MNVEEFAKALYDLIQNTDVTPSIPNPSPIRIKDAVIDICFRRALNIMVTFDVEAPSEDTFQERLAVNIRQEINRQNAELHLFHDRSDSNVLEHVGSFTTSNMKDMIAKIREMRWSHAYCPSANKVFDFESQGDVVVDKVASNTEHYLGKYYRWVRASANRTADDEGPWYMFQEGYTWHTSQFLALFGSINAVRAEIRRRYQTSPQFKWWHAWCDKTNQVVNFFFSDGKMASKIYLADDKFLARLCEMSPDFSALIRAQSPIPNHPLDECPEETQNPPLASIA